MKMMATSGSLIADETCRSTTHHWVERGINKHKEFAYTQTFDHHFCYRHAEDDHSNLHRSLPSWEDTWVTRPWELCVFAFILAICEVNTYLAIRFSEGKKKAHSLKFQEEIWMAVHS